MICEAGLPEIDGAPAALATLRDEHRPLREALQERTNARVALGRGHAREDYTVREARNRALREGIAFVEGSVPVTPDDERRRETLRLAQLEAEALRDLAAWGSRAVQELKRHRGVLEEIVQVGYVAPGGSARSITGHQVGQLIRQLDSGAFESSIGAIAESARHLAKTGAHP